MRIYFRGDCILFLTYIDIRNRFASVKKRTTVWLPLELIERLKKLSRKTGAPMAELFRRAVDSYVRRQT
jgi:ribbon-helix-helix protein